MQTDETLLPYCGLLLLGWLACARSPTSSIDALGLEAGVPVGTSALPGACAQDSDCNTVTWSTGCSTITPSVEACAIVPDPAKMCVTPAARPNQCCSAAECPTGRCVARIERPTHWCQGHLNGDGVPGCLVDECTSDGDCDGGVCAPPGVVVDYRAFDLIPRQVRVCIKASCRSDADCTAGPKGRCWLSQFSHPCCAMNELPVSELACVYEDGCVSDANCRSDQHCAIVAGRATCVPGACGNAPL